MKAYKRLWVTCRDLQLRFYKSREDTQHSALINEFSLRGCEVTPDVNLSQGKFVIKLEVPSADGMSEMFLRCENVSILGIAGQSRMGGIFCEPWKIPINIEALFIYKKRVLAHFLLVS